MIQARPKPFRPAFHIAIEQPGDGQREHEAKGPHPNRLEMRPKMINQDQDHIMAQIKRIGEFSQLPIHGIISRESKEQWDKKKYQGNDGKVKLVSPGQSTVEKHQKSEKPESVTERVAPRLDLLFITYIKPITDRACHEKAELAEKVIINEGHIRPVKTILDEIAQGYAGQDDRELKPNGAAHQFGRHEVEIDLQTHRPGRRV